MNEFKSITSSTLPTIVIAFGFVSIKEGLELELEEEAAACWAFELSSAIVGKKPNDATKIIENNDKYNNSFSNDGDLILIWVIPNKSVTCYEHQHAAKY
jgi:hypothetical protein